MNGGVHHGSAGVPADESVGRRGRNAPPPRQEIPNDSAEEPCHDDILIDVVEADHSSADVFATAVPRKNAARKLNVAAQTTASLGERTRVETTVAMLLAES